MSAYAVKFQPDKAGSAPLEEIRFGESKEQIMSQGFYRYDATTDMILPIAGRFVEVVAKTVAASYRLPTEHNNIYPLLKKRSNEGGIRLDLHTEAETSAMIATLRGGNNWPDYDDFKVFQGFMWPEIILRPEGPTE